MDYVTYNYAGALTGSYSQDLQPEHESCCIQVTVEQQQNWTSYRANAARDGVELIWVAEPDPDPPEIVPDVITALALRLALINAGQMVAVEAYFATLEGTPGDRARARFQFSPTAHRNCDLLLGVAAALGKTSTDIDALFIAAGAIQ